MADKIEEVLAEIRELKSWLYGSNGFQGDMPEIKDNLKDYGKRIRRVEIILAGLICSGALGGGIIGLIKWLGE